MKKIELLENEEILHKVKYSKKATFMNFLFLVLFVILYDYIPQENVYSIIAFIFMFVFVVPTFINLVINLFKRIFQRIYITNERVIIATGYFFKLFKIYYLKDVQKVFYKAKKFDNVNNASTIKVILKNNQKFRLNKITYGIQIAKLLTVKQNLNQN